MKSILLTAAALLLSAATPTRAAAAEQQGGSRATESSQAGPAKARSAPTDGRTAQQPGAEVMRDCGSTLSMKRQPDAKASDMMDPGAKGSPPPTTSRAEGNPAGADADHAGSGTAAMQQGGHM